MEKIVRIDDTGSTFDYLEEIVRCKDCKWLGVANLKDRYGQPYPVPCCRGKGNILLGITPDDYCSRAERREE